MRRCLICVVALAFTVACSNNPAAPGGSAAGGARTIINGVPTGSGSYASVGALLYDFDQNGVINGDDQLCTASLIAPTVVLTAAHCLAFLPAGSTLYVSFAPDLYAGSITTITATSYAFDSGFAHDTADPLDMGIVILPAGSTTGMTSLTLPTANLLDTLAAQNGLRQQTFVNVGYGIDATQSGRPIYSYDGKRRVSTSAFQSLQPSWLSLLMTGPATGQGGDCYGDSGGPKFLAGNTSMIVATVSWGDAPCRALSKNYRLDTASARSFLGKFVTLP